MAGDLGAVPSDQIVSDLIALYTDAQHEIALQVTRAVASGDLTTARRRAQQLRACLDVLQRLGLQADPLAREAIRQAAIDGADDAASGLRRIGVQLAAVGEQSFAAVNADAVAVMQDSIVAALQGARATVGRQVEDVFAREGRNQVMRSLLGAEASPQLAQRRLVRTLAEQGQTGFVDAGGRRWTLRRYAEMAVRTSTREAVVQGSVNRMVAHDVNLARVSIHPDSCTTCKPFEGRLVDLGGSTADFDGEPVMDASRLPPFHPNCRHTLQPFASRIERIRREMATAQGGA